MSKNILVIANSEAGSTLQSTDQLIEILKKHDTPFKLHEVTTPKEAAAVVKSVSKNSTTHIIVFGGDGTVLPVIKEAMKKNIPVLPLRGGSANGLARNIGVSNDLEANVLAYLSGSYVVHEFPVASVNDKPMLLDMHFGVFSKTLETTPKGIKKLIGDKAYHFYILKNATADNKEMYRMEIDENQVTAEAYWCFVLNINVMKVFGINVLRKAKPGFVHIMTVNTRNPFILFIWLVTKMILGKPVNKAITSWQAKKVIFRQAPDSMTFDDDNIPTKLPLTIHANTDQVRLIVPVLRKKGWNKLWSMLSTEYYRRKDHTLRLVTGMPSVRFRQVSTRLFLGGQYGSRAIKTFSEHGITGIVSMREYTPKPIDGKARIEILHLPTKDMTAPTLENLRQGVTFINKHIDEGGAAYVHCRLGEGRGPTMAAAYLISTGLTTDQALSHLRHYRPFARPNKKQVGVLREFENELQP